MGLISNQNVKPLNLSRELKKKDRFRVAIFGSARLKRDDAIYRDVFDLAKRIGEMEYDIVTGGGPGLMEAANAGHEFGDPQKKAQSIGLIIELPFEAQGNKYLELSQSFKRFSKRLDTFLVLSDVMVITKGGIGTVLELFYMWQHVQVKHVDFRPLILIGEMWEKLIDWVKDYALTNALVSPEDFDYVYIARDNETAMKIINAFSDLKKKEGVMRKLICDKSGSWAPESLSLNVKAKIHSKKVIKESEMKEKIVLLRDAIKRKN